MGYVNELLRVKDVNEKKGFSVHIWVFCGLEISTWRLAPFFVLEGQCVNLF